MPPKKRPAEETPNHLPPGHPTARTSSTGRSSLTAATSALSHPTQAPSTRGPPAPARTGAAQEPTEDEELELPPTTSCFRFNALEMYGTVPRSTISKQALLDNMRATFAVKWIIVAEEAHQDGTPHLHFVVRFTTRPDIKNMTRLDSVCGKHGNYQKPRVIAACLRYVRKSDPAPVEFGPVPTPTSSSKRGETTSFGELSDLIAGGARLQEVWRRFPRTVAMHLSKLKQFENFVKTAPPEALLSTPTSGFLSVRTTSTRPETQAIAAWLQANLSATAPRPRHLRSPQLFIRGDPLTHKTRLVHDLLKPRMRVYIGPREDFYDKYDDYYQLCVFDELTPDLFEAGTFNAFLDGQAVTLRVKGGQVLKEANPPTIVISNYRPDQLWSDSTQQDAFRTRVMTVDLGNTRLDLSEFVFEDHPAVPPPPPQPNPPPPRALIVVPDTEPEFLSVDLGSSADDALWISDDE